jgi:hypothetical protein
MALPSSGQISISDINTEFGLGNNLNVHLGATYYKSDLSINTFPNANISMSDFYNTIAVDPFPSYTYLANNTTLATQNANATASFTNVDIGPASPTRRIIFICQSDVYPPAASYTHQLTVNGSLVTRQGRIPEGSVEITNAFPSYTSRESIWITPVIPTGTTMSWTITSNCKHVYGTMSIIAVTNMNVTNASSIPSYVVSATQTLTNILPGTLILGCARNGSTTAGASNLNTLTSYTNLTYSPASNIQDFNSSRSTTISSRTYTVTTPNQGTGLTLYSIR